MPDLPTAMHSDKPSKLKTTVWASAWIIVSLFLVTNYIHGLYQLTQYSFICLGLLIFIVSTPLGKKTLGKGEKQYTKVKILSRVICIYLIGLTMFCSFILATSYLSYSTRANPAIILQESLYNILWYWGLFPWIASIITAIAFAQLASKRQRLRISKLLQPWFTNYKHRTLLANTIDNYLHYCMLAFVSLTMATAVIFTSKALMLSIFDIDIATLDIKNLILISYGLAFINTKQRKYRIQKLTEKGYGIGAILCYYLISLMIIYCLLNIIFTTVFIFFGITQPSPSYDDTLSAAQFTVLQLNVIAWCWWLSFALYAGTIIARICRGYSIRFACVLSLLPPALLGVGYYYLLYPNKIWLSFTTLLSNSPGVILLLNVLILLITYGVLRKPHHNGRIRYGALATDIKTSLAAKQQQQYVNFSLSSVALIIVLGISGTYFAISVLVLPVVLIMLALATQQLLKH